MWEASGLNFQVRPSAEATFLGSPLSISATSSSLRECRFQLAKGKERLLQMQSHEAFFLLSSSLGVPRLQFLLRSAPCCLSNELGPLDEELRSILEAVVNIKLSPESWCQASLPVRWGGIGLRCSSTLAPSAYLASLHSSSTLISLLLPAHFPVHPDGLLTRATEKWISVSGSACPVGQEASRQRAWGDGICHALSS